MCQTGNKCRWFSRDASISHEERLVQNAFRDLAVKIDHGVVHDVKAEHAERRWERGGLCPQVVNEARIDKSQP